MKRGVIVKDPVRASGARMTFTITALVEAIWFGLGSLLLPGLFIQWAFAVEAGTVELYFLRVIGVLCIALAAGCWYARDGKKELMKVMSVVMSIAKAGSTVILFMMMVAVSAQTIGFINPLLTAFLAFINIRLYLNLD